MRDKCLRRAVYIALSLSLVGLGLVVPCRSSAQGSKDTDTLKVGSTLPLNLGMGVETKKMLEVIVPNFNQAGGITVKGKKPAVDLIIYDDKYMPKHAEQALIAGNISQEQFARIVQAIENRSRPPWDTRLGGQIFIHGGGAEWDWTRGCIALFNTSMDDLFDMVATGNSGYHSDLTIHSEVIEERLGRPVAC